MTRKRDAADLWRTLKEQEAADDVEEILAMSDAELDQYIQANGGDPAAIRASGAALGNELLARRDRLAWQADTHAALEATREQARASKTTRPLPRSELLARLTRARTDPRFASGAAALFRKKTAEESTDEELQLLLDQIELLAKNGNETTH
jgi:hypothetical protein